MHTTRCWWIARSDGGRSAVGAPAVRAPMEFDVEKEKMRWDICCQQTMWRMDYGGHGRCVGDDGFRDDRGVLPAAVSDVGELYGADASAVKAQTVRLSYGPLISVDAVRAQYARPRLGRSATGDRLPELALRRRLRLPGEWVDCGPDDTLCESADRGVSVCVERDGDALQRGRGDVYGGLYDGAECCAGGVRADCEKCAGDAGLNVKSSKMDTLQTQYFSDSLIDSQVQAMLRPYVAERLG